mgnify:CR=1 FL=1
MGLLIIIMHGVLPTIYFGYLCLVIMIKILLTNHCESHHILPPISFQKMGFRSWAEVYVIGRLSQPRF